MNWEKSWVFSWNAWAQHHVKLVTFLSNDLVYLTILVALLTFLIVEIRVVGKPLFTTNNIRKFLFDGIVKIALPVGLATTVSEILSRTFPRQRPFVTYPEKVHSVFLHTADGGMPSHHTVFMIALAASTFLFSRTISYIVALMTLICACARIAAGIHYPMDILAAVVVGLLIPYLTKVVLLRLRDSLSRPKSA